MNTNSRKSRAVLVATLAVAVGGCATITYDPGVMDAMVAMNSAASAGNYEVVGNFESGQRPIFVLSSLITVVDAELEDALAREMSRARGDAVINLRIHEEYDIVDFAIGLAQSALMGIQLVQTRSVTLRGDVVRWSGPQDPEVEAAFVRDCREVAIPEPDGSTRPGHICIRPAADAAVEAAP